MADITADIFNFVFTVILVGVFLAWLSLMHSMYQSFTKTPFLDKFDNKSTSTPKVSVILPARNEEEFIGKCLETLSMQDYNCLLYTSPSPRDKRQSRMPSSA